MTEQPTDFDKVIVRLPSGNKATVFIPKVFTLEDAMHMMDWLALYLTDKQGEVLPLPLPLPLPPK